MRSMLALALLLVGLWLASLGLGGALVVALVVGLALTAGAARTAHIHGSTRAKIARHEAGHAAVARHVGGRIRSARIHGHDSGGLVKATLPTDDPRLAVAFWSGGHLALGSRDGADADLADIRRELRRVPAAERGRVHDEGVRLARQALAAQAGRVERDAARLEEKGRL